jgi:hypothetical protein
MTVVNDTRIALLLNEERSLLPRYVYKKKNNRLNPRNELYKSMLYLNVIGEIAANNNTYEVIVSFFVRRFVNNHRENMNDIDNSPTVIVKRSGKDRSNVSFMVESIR